MAADIVFSFDTTGSMSACIAQVRRTVEETTRRLFKDVPDLRIGVIAHGDYCDAPPRGNYVIRMLDLSSNVDQIAKFIRDTPNTSGGDMDECYELVLHEARRLTWRAGVPRVLVMIGDSNPHGLSYPQNDKRLDWRNELDLLTESKIQVYAVQALNYHESTNFYRECAKRTGGFHLRLNQFADVVQLIMAVVYKQTTPEQFKKHVDHVLESGRVSRSLVEMYGTLLGSDKPLVDFKPSDLAAVPPGRFQVLEVDKDCSIKDFVEANGAHFQKGRGFYQFTKRETVQERKEVILVNKRTGDMFSGDKARDMIGLPYGSRGDVKPGEGSIADFEVFIQSTSSNRKLIGGTKFLYEVERS
jgi:hypothetical protein